MKTALSGIVVACLLAGFGACNPLDLTDNVVLEVTKLDVPTAAAASAPFTVTLTLVTGGCTSFNRIDVQHFEQGVRLIPLGTNSSIRHKDVVCLDVLKEEPHDVQLEPPFTNPYTVFVEQGVQPDVTATVQIQ
ncbi:MAG TPA: hypothetical protein VFP77_00095 [Gemmatimonadaceae bacterium]|nr:hypothetical protein [Gemmatimonadaceae bacterium]